jgi:hypothetical protein
MKTVNRFDVAMASEPVLPTVLEILRHQVECTPDSVKLLCGELDRKEYEAVNAVLERIGGKWKGSKKAHLFSFDPRPLLAAVQETGKMPPKNPLAYFPTQRPVVDRMVELAFMNYVPEDARFGEFSAGQGAIVDALVEAGIRPEQIDICEIDELNRMVLERKGYALAGDDFLSFDGPPNTYDRILINPPFSVQGDRLAYITHIERAYELLRPHGVMVAIAPPGFLRNTGQREKDFLKFVLTFGEYSEIEAGAFKESGTGIATVMIYLEKISEKEEHERRTEPFLGYANYYIGQFCLWAETTESIYRKKVALYQKMQASPEIYAIGKDRTPSPKLAALIRQHLDELVAESLKEGNGVNLLESDFQILTNEFIDGFIEHTQGEQLS